MLGIFGTQGGRPRRRRRRWQLRRRSRPEPVPASLKGPAGSQLLFACHDRAPQAEESAWRLQQKLRVTRLDASAFLASKAGIAQVGLRMVPLVAFATLQHLMVQVSLRMAPVVAAAILQD